ncbi:hypothetical protein ABZV93_04535 [Actinopolymorpha sp. NPDC004070]|uniref:hypothetical protein n=1 Tax=Actinopolymorpha sp. NPDC004070 TaxID=3154548 RepID=UPI0033B1A33D
MSSGSDRRYVVAGGDVVAAFANKDDAAAQYRVMVGANLDVDTHEMTVERWDQVRRELSRNRDITVVDVAAGEQFWQKFRP